VVNWDTLKKVVRVQERHKKGNVKEEKDRDHNDTVVVVNLVIVCNEEVINLPVKRQVGSLIVELSYMLHQGRNSFHLIHLISLGW